MPKLRVILLAAAALACHAPARAQVYGQFTGAETVPAGGRLFGAYALSSENVVGLLAQLRLSFYPNVDFGFHGGIARQDFVGGDRTTVRLGTGLKAKIADPTAGLPVALAVGGDLAVETGDEFHVLTVGPTLVASRPFAIGSGGVTPYARIGLAITSIDVRSNRDTDISLPLRLGGDFRLTPQLGLAVELQLQWSDRFNDNVGLAAGVNLPF